MLKFRINAYNTKVVLNLVHFDCKYLDVEVDLATYILLNLDLILPLTKLLLFSFEVHGYTMLINLKNVVQMNTYYTYIKKPKKI